MPARKRPCAAVRKIAIAACRAVFAEERPHLLPLPDNPFPTEERVADAIARKTPYLRFDLNDYSIPHTHVGRHVEILASLERVRVVEGLRDHRRSPAQLRSRPTDREIPAMSRRWSRTNAPGAHTARSIGCTMPPPDRNSFYKLAAERGVHLGVLTRGLLQMLDTHGADALAQAIDAALGENAAHLGAVRHFIDAQLALRGERPPVAVIAAERSAPARHRAGTRLARLRTTHHGADRWARTRRTNR